MMSPPPPSLHSIQPEEGLHMIGVKECLKVAIDTKKDVFISYMRSTHGVHPHKITPNTFEPGKEGVLVHTYCHTAKADRSFFLYLITESNHM
jgi:hypothetical protein